MLLWSRTIPWRTRPTYRSTLIRTWSEDRSEALKVGQRGDRWGGQRADHSGDRWGDLKVGLRVGRWEGHLEDHLEDQRVDLSVRMLVWTEVLVESQPPQRGQARVEE